MRECERVKGLVDGVRALETFARHAPLDVHEFARRIIMPVPAAAGLIEAFEQSGYVRRTPHGSLFVLTMLGLTLVAGDNLTGALVARAAGSVDSLGRAGNYPATLSIRRGRQMLFCLCSQPVIGDIAVGTRHAISACPEGLVQFSADAILHGDRVIVPVLANHNTVGVLSFHGTAKCSEGEREFLFRLLADEAHRLARSMFDWRAVGPVATIAPVAEAAVRAH
jgi:hypothetical protein